MTPGIRMAIAAVLGLAAAPAPQRAWCQQGGPPPEWKAPEARLGNLADEVKFEGWAIRPPRGYQHRVTPGGNETRYLWGKQGEGTVVVIEAHVEPGRLAPEQAMEAYLGLLKGRSQRLEHTPFERGQVGGKAFLRTRFSAEGLPGIPGQGFGFVYLTFEGKEPLTVTGMGGGETIEALEASALTVRIIE